MLLDFNRDGKFDTADLLFLAKTPEAREALVIIAARQIVASETKLDDEAVLLLADITERAKTIIESGEEPTAQGYVSAARILLGGVANNVNPDSKGYDVFKAVYEGIRAGLVSLEASLDDNKLSGDEITRVVSALLGQLFSIIPLLAAR